MQLSNKQMSSRLFFVDLLKAVSIVAVVSFHSIFVPESTYKPVAQLVELLFSPLRFCVPVFLTLSFFLFWRGLEKPSDESIYFILKKRFVRLLIPTVLWFSLAIAVQIPNQDTAIKLMIMTLQGNIFDGAYYLLVLMQLLPIFMCFSRWFAKRRNVLITL